MRLYYGEVIGVHVGGPCNNQHVVRNQSDLTQWPKVTMEKALCRQSLFTQHSQPEFVKLLASCNTNSGIKLCCTVKVS